MSDVIITCNLILSKVIKLINIKVRLEIKWDSRFVLLSARQTLPPPPHGLLFDTQRDADEGNVGAVVEKG